jgi:quercetin dioxygenase-like cupin family protein
MGFLARPHPPSSYPKVLPIPTCNWFWARTRRSLGHGIPARVGSRESKMRMLRNTIAGMAAIAAGLLLLAASAQQTDIQRTDLLQKELSVADREVIQVRVDFAPGAASVRHVHPGEEIAYVLEGTLEYELEGSNPVTLRAGETLFIPANVAHAAKNVGPGKASELATYIVKKREPVFVPVD